MATTGEVPPGVVTFTLTVPEPGGAVAVAKVAESTVTPVAGVVSKRTSVAPVRFFPLSVTCVPPSEVPEVGLMEVNEGGGGDAPTKTISGLVLTVLDPVTDRASLYLVAFVRGLAGRKID